MTKPKRNNAMTSAQHVDLPASALRSMQEAARLGELAEKEGDLKTALLSVREYSRAIELIAKLRDNSGPAVDITRTAEWAELRDKMLAAIADCPSCSRRVIDALNRKHDVTNVVHVLPSAQERE